MSLTTLFQSLFPSRKWPARRGTAARRAALKVERFEDRTVPALISVAGGTMTIEGDGRPDLIIIRDNGDGDLSIFHGRTDDFLHLELAPAFENVETIAVWTYGGRDVVFYEQAGDRTRNMVLGARLGDGVDSFLANIRGDINAGVTLGIDVNGGDGGDFITVDATADVDIETWRSRAGVEFHGFLWARLHGDSSAFGHGRDTLTMLYEGELDGKLGFEANGGWGDDRLVAEVNLDNGSNGLLGGVLDGGQGGDELVFHITQDNPADRLTYRYAMAQGGTGDDRWDITSNVGKRNLDTPDDFV
jgi:hypothetical protein